MPQLIMRISGLRPNTLDSNNPNSESTWFSYVRQTYSRQYRGTISPPTMTQFRRSWNTLDQYFEFAAGGESLDDAKERLKGNIFPDFRPRPRYMSEQAWHVRLEAQVWPRMIIAFNAYAMVREAYGVNPSHKVDFIGTTSNSHLMRNKWQPRFHDRCIFNMSDENVEFFMDAMDNNRPTVFWEKIFELYDSQSYNRRLQNPSYARTPILNQETTRQTISREPGHRLETQEPRIVRPASPHRAGHVDNPNNACSQEYFARDESAEDDTLPNNENIAAMLNRTTELPPDLKKIIYDMILAAQFSWPIVEEEPEPEPESEECSEHLTLDSSRDNSMNTESPFDLEGLEEIMDVLGREARSTRSTRRAL